MMELAPEMVAVVFHQGFRFGRANALESVLACGQDDLPQWSTLANVVTLEPWAATLAKTVLSEPGGERFMVVAAGLEYLLQHARFAAAARGAGTIEINPGGTHLSDIVTVRLRMRAAEALPAILDAAGYSLDSGRDARG